MQQVFAKYSHDNCKKKFHLFNISSLLNISKDCCLDYLFYSNIYV